MLCEQFLDGSTRKFNGVTTSNTLERGVVKGKDEVPFALHVPLRVMSRMNRIHFLKLPNPLGVQNLERAVGGEGPSMLGGDQRTPRHLVGQMCE